MGLREKNWAAVDMFISPNLMYQHISFFSLALNYVSQFRGT